MKIRQCLVWVKNTMVLGRQDYQWQHEPCLYGWKEGAAHIWESDRSQTTVLQFDRPTRSVDHPTMKPVSLFEYMICNSTQEWMRVYDPFLGSGTALIASERRSRICYGMEIDPCYVDVAVKRWEAYTDRKAELHRQEDKDATTSESPFSDGPDESDD